MKRVFLFMVLCVFLWLNGSAQCNCSGSSSAVSIGETGNSALTLRKNKWQTEVYGDYRIFGQNQTPHDHSSHTHSNDTAISSSNELKNILIAFGGVRFGLTDRFTLSLLQPYIWLNATPQSGSGIGDLLFLSTAKLFDKKGFSVAILAGAKFPTGVKSNLSGENNLVIGSGSVDPVAGFSLVKAWNRSFFRANALYKYSTVGYDKVNFGSFMNYNLTFSYNLKGLNSVCQADSLNAEPDKFSCTVFVNIADEWYGEQIREHTIIENTGGYMLLSGIGTQLGFSKWYFPITFTIPLMQDLQGEQSLTKLRTRIGIIKTF